MCADTKVSRTEPPRLIEAQINLGGVMERYRERRRGWCLGSESHRPDKDPITALGVWRVGAVTGVRGSDGVIQFGGRGDIRGGSNGKSRVVSYLSSTNLGAVKHQVFKLLGKEDFFKQTFACVVRLCGVSTVAPHRKLSVSWLRGLHF